MDDDQYTYIHFTSVSEGEGRYLAILYSWKA